MSESLSESIVPVYPAERGEELDNEGRLWEEQEASRKAEELRKEEAKQSALAKLAKLGLTEEEAKAVIGL